MIYYENGIKFEMLEIANVHQIEKIILLSSIKSRKELPLSFKLIRPMRLDIFFRKKIILKTVNLLGKTHGYKTKSENFFFKSMVGKQTNRYLQWALRELSSWQTLKVPAETEIVQIHGTNDKTLPYKLVHKPDFTIENGSPICVLKRANEISELIKKIIQ